MFAPIALSDESLSALLQAARPLAVSDRDEFLRNVAERLSVLSPEQLGDGAVHRIMAEEQHKLLQPVDVWLHEPRPRGRPTKAAVA